LTGCLKSLIVKADWRRVIEVREISEEVARHIVVEFGQQGDRALGFLMTARGLLMSPLDVPKKGELVAYAIREALKSLLDTQAPAVRRKQGESTGWATRSRTVVGAHEAWLDSRSGSDEDQQAALKNLSISIGDMAEIHAQDDLNRKRLIAVLVDRTGSFPSGEGTRLVEEYSELVGGANASLHTEMTVDEATRYWDKSAALLETLFMPPTLRNERLEELAALDAPTQEDLAQLRRLVVVPGNLEKFLASLTDPAWLDLLETSGLIDPPKTQSWWVGHALVRSLKDTYPNEILDTLEKLFSKSTKDVQGIYSIAWAAHDLGAFARPLLLECLQLFPAAVAHLAIDEIGNGEPSDDFVLAVADTILNPSVLATEHYPDPLFEALVAGVNQDNYAERVTLLVQKIRKFDRKEDSPWSLLTFERGVSVADGGRFREDQHGLKLLHTLTQVITAALEFSTLPELLELTDGLSKEPKGRIRPWLHGQISTATADELLDEIESGLNSRLATIDDIALADKLLTYSPAEASDSRIEAIYGSPPPQEELSTALASNDIPEGWIYRYSWSPLFRAEAIATWKPTIETMSKRYGAPSKEKIVTKIFGEFQVAESPINIEDLAKKSKTELLETAVQWRPEPKDWLNSASDLAGGIVQVMKGDLPEWTADPVGIATALVHPTYISRYIRMLAEELGNFDYDAVALVALTDLVFDKPWPVERIGDEGQFDYDESWTAAQSASVELITKLANADAPFGEVFDSVVLRLTALTMEPEPDYEPSDNDPYERAINHRQSLAFQGLLAVAGWDYRTNGSVRSAITDTFTAVLSMKGAIAEEIRSLMATRVPFLNTVTPEWLTTAFPAIFNDDGDGSLGQATLDVALKWASPSRAIFEGFKPQVWEAVTREVPNALSKALIAMLWEVDGYSVKEVVTRLKTLDKLSSAGDSLGRLLSNSTDLEDKIVQIAIDFWEQAIASRTNEPLSGFGWFAIARQVDDEKLAELLKATLESMDEPLDASYQVSKRLGEATPSETVLVVFDLMVRRQSHSFDQRMTNGAAVQALQAATHLSDTGAYQRLQNALQERGLI